MREKEDFTLDVVSEIDEDIIIKNLIKRYQLSEESQKPKKKKWIPILAAAASFAIVFCSAFLFWKFLNVPVYLGMTVSNETVVSDTVSAAADSVEKMPLTAGALSLMPTLLSNADVDSDDSDSLDVSDCGIYYAMPGEDVYINVHIDNPEGFEILSFTLNGVKYSSYMFEEGSDLENLILKCNVGEEVGVKEYTIDAIKYVDGGSIKGARMKGERTVEVIVGGAVSSLDFEIKTAGGFAMLTPLLGEGMEALPEILSIDVYNGTELIAQGSLDELSVSGLPLNSRLLMVVSYMNGDSIEYFKRVFDTTKISKGLEISEDGYITGIGSCTETVLYLDKPIGADAFTGNQQIKAVYLGEGVSSVKYGAFSGCKNLEIIFVSKDVEKISSYAFANCPSLNTIMVDENNEIYRAQSNCLIEIETDCLILGCKNSDIPETVKKIGSRAFAGCTGLSSIVIPESVTSIEAYAFSNCKGLTDMIIPDSVTYIGESAFLGCEELGSIKLSAALTTIERSVFYDCKSLTSITIPDGVTLIGGSAFCGCNSLSNVEIPSSVITIDASAFYGCEHLVNLSIPEGVESIGTSAFYMCKGLQSVILPDSLTSIGESAFFGCGNLMSVKIPNGVTLIGKSAFCNCSKLKTLVISNSVEKIDDYAFYLCTELTTIIFEGTCEEWLAIDKTHNWNLLVAATEVQCADGTVAIG